MRLLPKDAEWISYVWLVYLAAYAVVPFAHPTPPWLRIVTVLSTIAGVTLYFWGFWLRDRRILIVVGGFVLLGMVLMPLNPAASTFFIYGASFLGAVLKPREAYWYLGGILAIVAIEALLFEVSPYGWVTAMVFSALIGMVLIQDTQKRRLMDSLLMVQDEAQRMAQLAERERIARDLHDLLGHTLSVIVLKSELASRLASLDPDRAVREIRDVEQISREALAEVRSAVQGYRAGGLDKELIEARRALDSAGVRLETSLGSSSLPPAVENVVAMSLREAVTNIVRHARASACKLSVRQRDGWCELEIADDGRGGHIEEGNGLRGMRTRVESAGGVFHADASDGMVIRIRVPV